MAFLSIAIICLEQTSYDCRPTLAPETRVACRVRRVGIGRIFITKTLGPFTGTVVSCGSNQRSYCSTESDDVSETSADVIVEVYSFRPATFANLAWRPYPLTILAEFLSDIVRECSARK
jgi:hypothetical protein